MLCWNTLVGDKGPENFRCCSTDTTSVPLLLFEPDTESVGASQEYIPTSLLFISW